MQTYCNKIVWQTSSRQTRGAKIEMIKPVCLFPNLLPIGWMSQERPRHVLVFSTEVQFLSHDNLDIAIPCLKVMRRRSAKLWSNFLCRLKPCLGDYGTARQGSISCTKHDVPCTRLYDDIVTDNILRYFLTQVQWRPCGTVDRSVGSTWCCCCWSSAHYRPKSRISTENIDVLLGVQKISPFVVPSLWVICIFWHFRFYFTEIS